MILSAESDVAEILASLTACHTSRRLPEVRWVHATKIESGLIRPSRICPILAGERDWRT